MMLALGLLCGLACLALQAIATMVAARYFARARTRPPSGHPRWAVLWLFSVLMLVLMIGNLVQVVVWGLVYWLVGGVEDIVTAVYFSGVTFTTLGYGDVLLKGQLRLLAPVQAVNGMMMLGITTAAFYAAIQHTIARHNETREQRPGHW